MMNPTTHEMAVPIASSVTLLLCLPFVAFAGLPDGYYDGVNAANSDVLRATLHAVIDDHHRFPYTSGNTDTWCRRADNHAIRLLASHLGLSLRDTVHQIVTHYLSTHGIDLLRAFGDRSLLAELDLERPGGTGK